MSLSLDGDHSGPSWVYHKNVSVRVVSGLSSTLSILGSALIILTYVCFRSLRTRARLILVHLALADLGVGLANLAGIIGNFDQYYVHNHTAGEIEPYKPNGSIDNLCKTEAFFALYCTLSSVLWTSCLAVYMYLLIVSKNQKQMKLFMWFAYLFCYGMPLLVTVWALCTHRLGFTPYDSSGWCGIIVVKPYMEKGPQIDFISAILGYDLWIFLTVVLIVVLYVSVYCYVRQQYRELRDNADSKVYWHAMHSIDYKFIVIPVMFIFLRMWSALQDILIIFLHIPPNQIQPLLKALQYLSGIGDSGQGFINAILFVAFTHSVRKRLLSCDCLKALKKRHRNIREQSMYSESRFLIKSSNPMAFDKRYSTLPQEEGVVNSTSHERASSITPSSQKSYLY